MKSASLLKEETGDGQAQVYRYIRLAELIPELLDLVDEGRIAFRPVVELSYLQKEEQNALLEQIAYADATPSLAQAIKLKRFSQDGKLNNEQWEANQYLYGLCAKEATTVDAEDKSVVEVAADTR